MHASRIRLIVGEKVGGERLRGGVAAHGVEREQVFAQVQRFARPHQLFQSCAQLENSLSV